jgi:hypothetical protein
MGGEKSSFGMPVSWRSRKDPSRRSRRRRHLDLPPPPPAAASLALSLLPALARRFHLAMRKSLEPAPEAGDALGILLTGDQMPLWA